ncbi:MAG: S41 family peptidase [Planctomycetota bacterium]
MLSRNFTVILLATVVATLCHLLHQRTRVAIVVGQAMEMIDQFYVEPVDTRDLLVGAMKGMTDQLDRNSEFIAPRDYSSFQDSIDQEFAGIGIYISGGTTDDPDGPPVRVVTPLVGSPALEAGLMPGDEFVVIDGEDVSAMGQVDVSQRLRGPIGTTVSVTIRRLDQDDRPDQASMSVRRDTIQLESVIGDHRDEANRWVYRIESHPEIAYVRMTSFGDKTVSELRGVLGRLDNQFAALILDLRGNGGGLLSAAVDVSDMFLASGKIVSTKVRGGRLEEEAKATPTTLVEVDKPMAVLIDGLSASASEIVSAALQDHGRAHIVGQRSYGKGTVQSILPLEYGRSALRLTVAKFYRPNDHPIHRSPDATDEDEWGVTPDDGLSVERDEEAMIQLARLWEQASYPSLKGASRPKPPADSNETSSDAPSVAPLPDDATVWDFDAVLRRAVERLTREMRSTERQAA